MPPTIALALLLGAQAELNLPKPDESIALVARRISTRAIPFTPGDFNLEFRAKYEVVKVVYGSYDRPAIDSILARMTQENYSFQSLILGISESLPFQKRRGESPH